MTEPVTSASTLNELASRAGVDFGEDAHRRVHAVIVYLRAAGDRKTDE